MNFAEQKNALIEFLFDLQKQVKADVATRDIDVVMRLHDIGGANGLILSEVWCLYEGVRRVLAGEDAPTNLSAFLTENGEWEEESLGKIPSIAYAIQQKIFDPLFPILKAAGFQLKDGKVPPPPAAPIASPYAPVPSPLSGSSFQVSGSSRSPATASGLEASISKLAAAPAPLDEKYVRALVRIAAGTTYSEQKLREAFEDLPQGLRNAVASVDTANAVQGIAKKYFLHVDQMGALASETGLVLLGLTHPADFIPNLAKRLRVPEDKAKEIAREISAQILGKVREALRTLHESSESSNSQFPISKQAQKTNIQNTNQKTSEPLRKLNVMPAQGAVNTPYSAGAKWNTGENILNKQKESSKLPARQGSGSPFGTQPPKAAPTNNNPRLEDSAPPFLRGIKGDTLSRDEVMRGIENPDKFKVQSSKFESQLPTSNSQLKTPVGPTGWKPPAADGGKSQFPISNFQGNQTARSPFPKYPINKLETVAPKPPAAPRPSMPPPPTASAAPQDFLDQKLQGPASLPKEERKYSSDPYREPLE